jgi:hypothetical protein
MVAANHLRGIVVAALLWAQRLICWSSTDLPAEPHPLIPGNIRIRDSFPGSMYLQQRTIDPSTRRRARSALRASEPSAVDLCVASGRYGVKRGLDSSDVRFNQMPRDGRQANHCYFVFREILLIPKRLIARLPEPRTRLRMQS